MVYSPKRSQGSNKNGSLYAKIIIHYYLWLQTLGLGRISMLKSNVHFLYGSTPLGRVQNDVSLTLQVVLYKHTRF